MHFKKFLKSCLKTWQQVFILLLLILFSPFPKASLEHSLLTPGAQREAAGALQGRQGCQVGSDQGRSRRMHRLDQSLKLWGSPADAFPFLGQQGARTGLQGQVGAQSVRRDGCTRAAAALKCNACSPSPAAHRLTQAAISSDCSGTADFNVNLLLLPFEINTASSLILPVA